MQKTIIIKIVFLIIGLTVYGCQLYKNQKIDDRNTFVRFFDFPFDISPSDFLQKSDGGYFISANSINAKGSNLSSSVWFSVDANGFQKKFNSLDSATSKTIIHYGEDFLIIGEKLMISNDGVVTRSSLFIIKINALGDILATKEYKQGAPFDNNAFITGNAAVINEPDSLVVVGSILDNNDPKQVYIAKIDAKTLELRWARVYTPLNQGGSLSFVNGKRLLALPNKNVIWSATAQRANPISGYASFVLSPSAYPYLPNPSYVNGAEMGNLGNDTYYETKEITPSLFGFGIIGRTSNTRLTRSRTLFYQLDLQGNFIRGSLRNYNYDSVKTSDPTTYIRTEDTGESITKSVTGGFYLAGSYVPLSEASSNKDIFLMHIDAQGNLIWKKRFGKSGSDTPVRVIAHADGLGSNEYVSILCETNLENQKSIALIRVDASGNVTAAN